MTLRLCVLSAASAAFALLCASCTQPASTNAGGDERETVAGGLYAEIREEYQRRVGEERVASLRVPEEIPAEPEFAQVDRRRITVKFRDGAAVRMRAERLATDRSALAENLAPRLERAGLDDGEVTQDLRALDEITRTGRATIVRLSPVSEEDLDAVRIVAELNTDTEHPDLNSYYTIVLPEDAGADAVLASVRALASVETAYFAPIPVPAADLPPRTNIDLRASQGYLRAAPRGIDVDYARGFLGGRGEGVRIVDIEYGWNAAHEDLPPRSRILVDLGSSYHLEHGTAVVGELWAEENGIGITGITPLSRVGRVSPWYDGAQVPHNVHAALATAAGYLGRGDIILIEQQFQIAAQCPQPSRDCGMAPVETVRDVYDMILSLTDAASIVIVEAAGNGQQRIDATFGDSGAIMVGAGDSRTRVPSWFTNYGARVDVHAWGDSIATLGAGEKPALQANGADPLQWYDDDFGGTSGASPIVAGAAALIQASRREANLPLLNSREMRQLLISTGTPQATDLRHIGPMPNLRAAMRTYPARPIPPGATAPAQP